MWTHWMPWRFILKQAARKHGFMDPLKMISGLQQFGQPSEIAAPVELLRAGAVMHARGLVNSQVIQNNLDWIWPYWVERQFNPRDVAFVPRAFSATHINLTHRNWTAVGIPDCDALPIVDPRGLLTPCFDGWSLDVWLAFKNGKVIFPSKMDTVEQSLSWNNYLQVSTKIEEKQNSILSEVSVIVEEGQPVCRMCVTGYADSKAWLGVVLRPYHPEGISFIHDIESLSKSSGWKVNGKDEVLFRTPFDRQVFSSYKKGDVSKCLFGENRFSSEVKCRVGLATAAALFELQPRESKSFEVRVPLKNGIKKSKRISNSKNIETSWQSEMKGICQIKVPDQNFQFLYDAALRTVLLHSPGDIYPGPFTYKRFWFRDACFILHALIRSGFVERSERVIDQFLARQQPSGYFRSQEGEWDSNGQVLWIMNRFCELTGKKPKGRWRKFIKKGGEWILRKRLPKKEGDPHAGLLPAGFSAEHFGPNDFYYWDNFWSVSGLSSGSELLRQLGNKRKAEKWFEASHDILEVIQKSLERVSAEHGNRVMPAAPERRVDSAVIGSLVAGYPLGLWSGNDPRLIETANYLLSNSLIKGAFFHDMSHSGLNPYLTLHLAQILLRSGDARFFELMSAVARLSSSTGQWPEAVHPATLGGCMGDGQHAWASAEWILMMQNLFVREENSRLILCSGIPEKWLKDGSVLFLGPLLTRFGVIHIQINTKDDQLQVSWKGNWYREEPKMEIHLQGSNPKAIEKGSSSLLFSVGVNK